MSYSPLSALKAWVQSSGPKIVERGADPLILKTPDGEPVADAKPVAETVCFPLHAFTNADQSLPDDFLPDLGKIVEDGKAEGLRGGQAVGAWLRGHVRHDGGMYMGAYELPGDKAGTVIVYGDPLMSEMDARQASLRYRKWTHDRLSAVVDAGRQAV